MSRLVGLSVLMFLLSCSAPVAPEPRRVWNVSPRALWDAYTTGAGRSWTGARVGVYLPAESYRIEGKQVLWHSRRMSGSPHLVFEGLDPPKTNTRPLNVTGVVVGPVRDGFRREGDIDWYVLVTDCTVRPEPAPTGE